MYIPGVLACRHWSIHGIYQVYGVLHNISGTYQVCTWLIPLYTWYIQMLSALKLCWQILTSFETRKHKNISNKSNLLRRILKEPAIVCLKTKFAILETLPRRYFSRSMEGSNPYQKADENVALSAKWKVHIWNRLRECTGRLYIGTLKRYPHQRSNLRRFKTQFEVICHWCNFKNSPQSNREMRWAMPRAGRRPTTSQVQKVQKNQKFQKIGVYY